MNMPAAIVIFVCKTVLIAGPPDPNAGYTGHENRDWDFTDSVMHCRRIEMPMFDQAEAMGADPQPFNVQRCQMSLMMAGPRWDEAHKNNPGGYRFWRGACPVPIVDTRTGKVLSFKMPECPSEGGTVVCEVDSAI